MERGLVINALQMALLVRKPEKGLLHHSDRGSQYASNDYQKLLSDNQIDCSMSRKGNCYDNAGHPMPLWKVFLLLSNRNSYIIASTRPGKKQNKTFLNTLRFGTIENEGIRRWAT